MGMKPIDWPELIKRLSPCRGDLMELHREMQLEGISISFDSLRAYKARRTTQPRGNAALWLYFDAQKRGVEIPYKDAK
jgi:hypothetical protein